MSILSFFFWHTSTLLTKRPYHVVDFTFSFVENNQYPKNNTR